MLNEELQVQSLPDEKARLGKGCQAQGKRGGKSRSPSPKGRGKDSGKGVGICYKHLEDKCEKGDGCPYIHLSGEQKEKAKAARAKARSKPKAKAAPEQADRATAPAAVPSLGSRAEDGK